MIRLNLASGTDIRPAHDGWFNLDVVPQWPGFPPCEVLWDARKDPIPFPNESVDEVVAGYLLLHLAPRHHGRVLDDIYRVMKPGAKLQVGEVDMALAMARWLDNPDDRSANEMVWGEQGVHEDSRYLEFEGFDKHCCGFTEKKLRRLLERHQFRFVGRKKIHAPEVWYELTMECYR